MAGLLALETSFETRKLHLGYRSVQAVKGPFTGDWLAHEFHDATTRSARGDPVFALHVADGNDLGPQGLIKGTVSGSFVHLIDHA
jgi:cobyrinic acid a,c-diamide synthase